MMLHIALLDDTIMYDCSSLYLRTFIITSWNSAVLPNDVWLHGVTPGGVKSIRVPTVVRRATYRGVREILAPVVQDVMGRVCVPSLARDTIFGGARIAHVGAVIVVTI
jgi:hypothetical protein